MSTERDELAADIRGLGITVIDGPPVDLTEPLAQHLHNLGYRKPRTITTCDELEALPDESVILDGGGVAWQKSHGTFDGKGKWFAAKRNSGFYYSNNFFDRVPITVLHEGSRA